MYLNAHLVVYFGDNYEAFLTEVISVDCDNSVDNIGATCEIVVPINSRYVKNNDKPVIAPTRTIFKTGMPMKVVAYYDGYESRTVFSGYVLKFIDGTPMKIVCEDQAYKLRFGQMNKTWNKGVRLKEILQYICDFAGVKLSTNVVDAPFISFYLKKVSPKYALQQIKTDMELNITFINGELICTRMTAQQGLPYNLDTSVNVIACDIQQTDDVFKDFAVEVVYKDSKGKRHSYKTKETSMEYRKYEINGMPLKNIALQAKDIENALKAFQFEGTITTLLYPVIDCYSLVKLTNRQYPTLSGTYIVRRTNISLSADGFKNKLTVAMLRQ